ESLTTPKLAYLCGYEALAIRHQLLSKVSLTFLCACDAANSITLKCGEGLWIHKKDFLPHTDDIILYELCQIYKKLLTSGEEPAHASIYRDLVIAFAYDSYGIVRVINCVVNACRNSDFARIAYFLCAKHDRRDLIECSVDAA